jgi:hypothetical protein
MTDIWKKRAEWLAKAGENGVECLIADENSLWTPEGRQDCFNCLLLAAERACGEAK